MYDLNSPFFGVKMAEDEVKKTGGQVDGKRVPLASVPSSWGKLMRLVFPDSNQRGTLNLMQAGDLVF